MPGTCGLDVGTRAPSSAGGAMTRSLASLSRFPKRPRGRGLPGNSGRPSAPDLGGQRAVALLPEGSEHKRSRCFCDCALRGRWTLPRLLHADTRRLIHGEAACPRHTQRSVPLVCWLADGCVELRRERLKLQEHASPQLPGFTPRNTPNSQKSPSPRERLSQAQLPLGLKHRHKGWTPLKARTGPQGGRSAEVPVQGQPLQLRPVSKLPVAALVTATWHREALGVPVI